MLLNLLSFLSFVKRRWSGYTRVLWTPSLNMSHKTNSPTDVITHRNSLHFLSISIHLNCFPILRKLIQLKIVIDIYLRGIASSGFLIMSMRLSVIDSYISTIKHVYFHVRLINVYIHNWHYSSFVKQHDHHFCRCAVIWLYIKGNKSIWFSKNMFSIVHQSIWVTTRMQEHLN